MKGHQRVRWWGASTRRWREGWLVRVLPGNGWRKHNEWAEVRFDDADAPCDLPINTLEFIQ